MIETELKLGLVDPTQLSALLASLPAPSRDVEQVNTYLIDPDGRLAGAGIMLRLRTVRPIEAKHPTACVLTAKRRRSAEAGVFIADEYEQPVPVASLSAVQATPSALLTSDGTAIRWVVEHAGPTDLVSRGTMRNRRRVIPYEGFTLEVDTTTFPGGITEVEIEVETDAPERARTVVTALCEDAGVRLFEQPLGKYARFLRHTGG